MKQRWGVCSGQRHVNTARDIQRGWIFKESQWLYLPSPLQTDRVLHRPKEEQDKRVGFEPWEVQPAQALHTSSRQPLRNLVRFRLALHVYRDISGLSLKTHLTMPWRTVILAPNFLPSPSLLCKITMLPFHHCFSFSFTQKVTKTARCI